MAVALAVLVSAIATLDSAAEGGLVKKPTVADLEAEVGSDVTGAERDAAWSEFKNPDEGTDAAESLGAAVTNRHASPLSISGISIPIGATVVVPDFDRSNGVLARWIDAGVIGVE